jgi:sulfhydrogenase subunit beta (sulfur reductase)
LAEQKQLVVEASELEKLIRALQTREFEVIGPTVRDGAIILAHLESAKELPTGWTDEQKPGHYRLTKREDAAIFGYAVGPQSWKQYFHPPHVKLWEAETQGFRIFNNGEAPKHPYALLGVRPCELAAIRIQDRVLLEDKYPDAIYVRRRANAFIVAVQCTNAAPTCFCCSTGSGPAAENGFDLALTELLNSGGTHRFVVETGSERGAEILAEIQAVPASEQDVAAAASARNQAREQVRKLDTNGLKKLLYQNFESPRWDVVTNRCLACANCTMVCPTCFCTTVEDVSDLSGEHAERWRHWDSCFTLSFSYIHGGSIRTSGKARYRQWITHKLAAWDDQFGSLGCVGCGRCITWCPAGIDITEEVHAIREAQHGKS